MVDPTLHCRFEAISRALEHCEPELAEHSEATAYLAIRLAHRLKRNTEMKWLVWWAARFHDIGKIAVPKAILNKPAALTPEERRIVRLHPTYAFVILRRLQMPADLLHGVLFHHERFDGNGYPTGLSGEEIPLAARILAVADVYSALTSDRPYREAFNPVEALALMQRDSGRAFDPKIITALEECVV